MINKRASHLDNPITHQYIKHPLTTLTQFNRNPRPWHMPLFVAFAISFPVMIGAYLSDLRMGLLASLGAMVILNLPYTGSLLSRMTTVLACSFGMVACFAVGLVAHNVPILTIPLMFFVTFWCTLFSRYYNTKPKKYNKVRFTHHFWRDIASGASYASYTSKTLTIGFGISYHRLLGCLSSWHQRLRCLCLHPCHKSHS